MGRVIRRVKSSWNIFRDAPQDAGYSAGRSTSPSAQRSRVNYYNDRSIIGSIYTRLSVDLSQILFYHAMTDPATGVVKSVVRDSLNQCLTLRSNIDQTSQFLFQDAALTMMEYGVCAITPIDADMDPLESSSYDIETMRVGRIVAWFPRKVTIEVYDDREVDENGNPVNGGITKQVTVPKDQVAIVENPFANVMNAPNGTLQRLIRKLNLLDGIDEAAGSGKLDLIFQLPYTVRGASRQEQAAKRRDDLYQQLKDDELGIGYIDVSEKVIQLNRPIDNKLLDEIKELYALLFSELGLTPEIMNSTASQDVINMYYERTVDPFATAIALEMKSKFLTQTALTQGHSIETYRDPLRLIPIGELAEVVDKLLRNAAITANELRPKIGFMPSADPRADELANPNMPTEMQPGGKDDKTTEEVSDGEGLPGSDSG